MMNKYPLLEINVKIIHQNASILLRECKKNGIETFAVIKGFNALPPIVKTLADAGYKTSVCRPVPGDVPGIRRTCISRYK